VAPQVAQSAPTSTDNWSISTSINDHQTVTTWLYGDTPSASNSKVQFTEPTNTLVAIGPGLPPLPKKLVQQIKAGEFINFSNLPPAEHNRHRITSEYLILAESPKAPPGSPICPIN